MTQHTDMGGLVERLNQAADDLVSGATIFSDRVYGLLIEAADAIEALSIPQGLGEVELHDPRVIELAGVLFKAEHPNSEWSPGRAAPCWFFRACTAINALTSARAQ